MKSKLFYLVWSIYRDIAYSGLDDAIVNRDLRKKIVRFNQFVVLALLVNFFSVIVYFYNKLCRCCNYRINNNAKLGYSKQLRWKYF